MLTVKQKQKQNCFVLLNLWPTLLSLPMQKTGKFSEEFNRVGTAG